MLLVSILSGRSARLLQRELWRPRGDMKTLSRNSFTRTHRTELDAASFLLKRHALFSLRNCFQKPRGPMSGLGLYATVFIEEEGNTNWSEGSGTAPDSSQSAAAVTPSRSGSEKAEGGRGYGVMQRPTLG